MITPEKQTFKVNFIGLSYGILRVLKKKMNTPAYFFKVLRQIIRQNSLLVNNCIRDYQKFAVLNSQI